MLDNLKMAELLLPHIDKTPDYYEALYPERNLKDGAKVTRVAPSPTGYLHIGTLFTGAKKSVEQLFAFKWLTGLVLFNNDDWQTLNKFVCSEAFSAFKTLSSSANSLTLIGGTVVNNLTFFITAIGTFHNLSPFSHNYF